MSGRPEAAAAAVPARGRRATVDAVRAPALPVVSVWAAWLAAILAVVVLLTATGLIDPAHRHDGGRLWPLWWWDWTWYAGIAQSWYPPEPAPAYAFFPLWPALLRASGPVPDWMLGGALAAGSSLLCFTGVAAAGRGLVDGHRSALVLACFPGSIWLALVYPDALAVGAAAWACALAARGRPLASATAGATAALARPAGLLVSIPIVALAARRGGRLWIAAAAPLAAAAAVEGYFWYRSGAVNAFFQAQRHWHRDGPKPWIYPRQFADMAGFHPEITGALAVAAVALFVVAWRAPRQRLLLLGGAYVLAVVWIADASGVDQLRAERLLAAFVLPLTILLWRLGPRFRVWAVYATAVIGLSLLSGSLQSFGRQALLAFPLVWAVAEGPPVLRGRWAAAAGIAVNVVLLWTLGRFAP